MEYITIKDFASRAGVSPQAIYQRIDKDLKQYIKEVDGKKRLDIKALELFVKPLEQEKGQAVDKDMLKALQDTLTVLTTQLAEKDKQIDFLQGQLQAAQMLHAGTIQKQLTEGQPEEKPRRWWQFGRKGGEKDGS